MNDQSILDMNGKSLEYKVTRVVPICGVCEDAGPITLSNEGAVRTFFTNVISQSVWFDPDKECVVVIALDRKNNIIGYNLVSLGDVSSCMASPREVFRPLVVGAASAFILIHNHPSGNPAPSSADIAITKMIKDASNIMNITFLDHIIIGSPARDPIAKGYYSFREDGLI